MRYLTTLAILHGIALATPVAQQQYGPPPQQYGSPPQQYGPPSAQYGPPPPSPQTWGPPPSQPGRPGSPLGPPPPPQPQSGRPGSPLGPPGPQGPQYGPPGPQGPQYGPPQPQPGRPQGPQYGPPQPQPGRPQGPQYGPPPQYGAPQPQYGPPPQYNQPSYYPPNQPGAYYPPGYGPAPQQGGRPRSLAGNLIGIADGIGNLVGGTMFGNPFAFTAGLGEIIGGTLGVGGQLVDALSSRQAWKPENNQQMQEMREVIAPIAEKYENKPAKVVTRRSEAPQQGNVRNLDVAGGVMHGFFGVGAELVGALTGRKPWTKDLVAELQEIRTAVAPIAAKYAKTS